MKFLLQSLVIMALTAPAFANATLKDVMDDMYDSMSTITDALIKNKPIPDDQLKAAASAVVASTIEASKILPDELKGADGQPLPAQKEAIAKYNDLMTRLIAALTEVDQDVKAGKKAEAKDVLVNKVAPIQKEGHLLFKHSH